MRGLSAMTESAFDQVKRLILGLSPAELQEVRSRCALIMQGGAATAPTASAAKASTPADADTDLILEVISDFLREQGIEYAGVQKLKGMANFRAFAEKVPESMKYFRSASRNRTKQRALIRMGCRLLFQDMNRMSISPSVRTLMNHWHRVPAVINRSFPGYAHSGLLGLLVRDGRSVDRYVLREAAEGAEDDAES